MLKFQNLGLIPQVVPHAAQGALALDVGFVGDVVVDFPAFGDGRREDFVGVGVFENFNEVDSAYPLGGDNVLVCVRV